MNSSRIIEGVVTGLIVAALGYAAVQLWRRFHSDSASSQGLQYAGSPAPQVIDSAGGTTTFWPVS